MSSSDSTFENFLAPIPAIQSCMNSRSGHPCYCRTEVAIS